MTSPKRRTREETRQLVVEAALDLIRLEGLGAEPTTISYQRVFDHLESTKGTRVTRASVHERIWDSQEDFQHEVLLRASETASGMSSTRDTALRILVETTGQHPFRRMSEMTRHAIPANVTEAEADELFYSWVGMTMSLAKDRGLRNDRREDLKKAADAKYDEFRRDALELLYALGDTLGVRPRADLFSAKSDGFEFIARVGIVLSEGASVATRFDQDALPLLQLKTGPEGEEQTWTAFAAAYWALLSTYLEVDPDVHPDLGTDESERRF